MGNCLSYIVAANCLFRLRRSKVDLEIPSRRVTLAIIGLDGAGKTVIAKMLAGEPFDDELPTIGFSRFEFSLTNHIVSLYDIGGGPSIRAIWKRYFGEIHGLVFVVDSGRRDRLSDSKLVLTSVVNDDRVTSKPLLILANKQDLSGAMDDSELCEVLQVEELVNQQQCLCRIVCCSAICWQNGKPDDSIFGGVQWLLEAIDSDWTNLEPRVKVDIETERKREEIEKQEKIKRIEELRKQISMKKQEEDEKDVIAQNPFQRLDQNYFKKS